VRSSRQYEDDIRRKGCDSGREGRQFRCKQVTIESELVGCFYASKRSSCYGLRHSNEPPEPQTSGPSALSLWLSRLGKKLSPLSSATSLHSASTQHRVLELPEQSTIPIHSKPTCFRSDFGQFWLISLIWRPYGTNELCRPYRDPDQEIEQDYTLDQHRVHDRGYGRRQTTSIPFRTLLFLLQGSSL
jgi:hypothetical protein